MWLQAIWFAMGFATGLFFHIIFENFHDAQARLVNLVDLRRYIFNESDEPNSQHQNSHSLNSASSQRVISNPPGQSKSLTKNMKKNSAVKKIASSGGKHQNSHSLSSASSQRVISNPPGQRQNSHSLSSASSQRVISNPPAQQRTPNLEAQHQTPNLAFYENKIPAKPNNQCIEEILLMWKGNYHLLQSNSTYIQWLFPNRNPGTNTYARVLTDEEVLVIQDIPELRDRVKRAFEMMLDFYGMTLTKDNQILLSENSNQRLKQLNQKNNAQFCYITRILLALKELGNSHLMLPFIECLAKLIYQEKKLNHAKLSFEQYWIETLDVRDRMRLMEYDTPKSDVDY